jgi:hypothetical protein
MVFLAKLGWENESGIKPNYILMPKMSISNWGGCLLFKKIFLHPNHVFGIYVGVFPV